jgi:hypothetical protein
MPAENPIAEARIGDRMEDSAGTANSRGVGGEMIATDALKARDRDALSKLTALFVDLVRDARKTSEKP